MRQPKLLRRWNYLSWYGRWVYFVRKPLSWVWPIERAA